MPHLFNLLTTIHVLAETSSSVLNFFSNASELLQDSEVLKPTRLDVAKDWQTLIAGLIAFVPASFAAVFVWRQVNEQRIQFLKAQEADGLKARLRLSRNISHVSRHLDRCYDRLLSKDFSYEKHALPEKLLDDILEAGIASRENNFDFFRDYIEKIQTYASLCGKYSDIGGEMTLVKCFKLLGEIDALTDRLYPFSRFEVHKLDESDVTIEEVKGRLQHNLRRGKDISETNLEALLSLFHFDR